MPVISCGLLTLSNAPGDSKWCEFLLKSLASAKKQFLGGYLCADLYYLTEDACSRQILLADSDVCTSITTALLAAASSTAVLVRLLALRHRARSTTGLII